MRLTPVLLLIVACSGDLSERAPGVSSRAQSSSAAGFSVDRSSINEGSYVTPWSDSSKLGDTTFYSSGRVVTTLAIFTDSQWTRRPNVAMGLPAGPFNLPLDSLCTLDYTGTTLTVVPSRVIGDLDRIRQCGLRTFAQIRRPRLKDSAGNLSVQATRAELDTWPWDGLCNRVKDSTIIAYYIGDDVTADEWGPAPLATRLAQWDTIAGLVQARCPGAPVAIRALPTQLETRPNWQWLTTGWAQYPGPRPRWGAPEKFFGSQIASAKRQRLGVVAGLNLLDGGCGPEARGWCLEDVPGTTLPGTRTDFYQMSGAELIYYKTVAMLDPYVCASVDWSWGPNFRSSFHDRQEIRSAAKVLAVIAAKRPRTSCVQR